MMMMLGFDVLTHNRFITSSACPLLLHGTGDAALSNSQSTAVFFCFEPLLIKQVFLLVFMGSVITVSKCGFQSGGLYRVGKTI